MDKTQVFIFVLLIAVLGFRIYQKYFNKNKNKQGTGNKSSEGSQSSPSSKDDEYEPYSKK
jgi:uncharacterized membrane protein YebE (DUF533 family)